MPCGDQDILIHMCFFPHVVLLQHNCKEGQEQTFFVGGSNNVVDMKT